MGDVRVATYNVLSSHLSEASHFVKCAADDLEPATRLARVKGQLEREIARGAVICLQEVSQPWSGELQVYFAERGYQMVCGCYGSKFNGYMGTAVAWPTADFELRKLESFRVADARTRRPVGNRTRSLDSRVFRFWWLCVSRSLSLSLSLSLVSVGPDVWREREK